MPALVSVRYRQPTTLMVEQRRSMGRLQTAHTPLLNGNSHRNAQEKTVALVPKKPLTSLSIFSIRLLIAAIIATLAYYASFGLLGRSQLGELHPLDFAARTQRLLGKYGIFDGHNDLVCEVLLPRYDVLYIKLTRPLLQTLFALS